MGSNNYKYLQTTHADRITEAKRLLGGKCVKCGTTDDLQFDHIDPKTKLHKRRVVTALYRWSDILSEIKLCQLLCAECHREKTCSDMNFTFNHSDQMTCLVVCSHCNEICEKPIRKVKSNLAKGFSNMCSKRCVGLRLKQNFCPTKPIEHGTESGYRKKCRCLLCKRAHADKAKMERAKKG